MMCGNDANGNDSDSKPSDEINYHEIRETLKKTAEELKKIKTLTDDDPKDSN